MTVPMRFRQYIQVKADEGGECDPEIICPADGWVKPESPYTPPVETPEPNDQEVIFLCSSGGDGVVCISAYPNPTGAMVWSLYDAITNDLLDTQTLPSGSKYTFYASSYPTVAYFLLKVKPEDSEKVFFSFRVQDEIGYSDRNWPILYANLTKAPDIIQLTEAFYKIMMLQRVDFPPKMNILWDLYGMFRSTAIQWVKFPVEMNVLKRTSYLFRDNTEIYQCYWPQSLPELSDAQYQYYGCTSLLEYYMAANCPKLEDLTYHVGLCSNLRNFVMPTNLDLCEDLDYTFYQCAKVINKMIFPEMPNIKTLRWCCYGMTEVTHIEFTGAADYCTTMQRVAYNCPNLKYFKFPTSLDVCSDITYSGYNADLETLIMPNYFGYNGIVLATGLGSKYGSTSLKEVQGTMECGANTYIRLDTSNKWAGVTEFNKPLAKFDMLYIGASGGVLEYVEVDWANSSWRASTTAIQLYGNLSDTEIDRIFTALPVVAGSQSIDIINNPGFATCDPSIAQVKGWTVTGA